MGERQTKDQRKRSVWGGGEELVGVGVGVGAVRQCVWRDKMKMVATVLYDHRREGLHWRI